MSTSHVHASILGSGIPAAAESGEPRPVPRLTDLDRQILETLAAAGDLPTPELAEILEADPKRLYRRCRRMADGWGLLTSKMGRSSKSVYVRLRRRPKDRRRKGREPIWVGFHPEVRIWSLSEEGRRLYGRPTVH